jgi:hypothetical protein
LGASGSAVVESVIVLMEVKKGSESSLTEKDLEEFQALLASGRIWFPLVELADESRRQISMMSARSGEIDPSVHPLIEGGHILDWRTGTLTPGPGEKALLAATAAGVAAPVVPAWAFFGSNEDLVTRRAYFPKLAAIGFWAIL